MHNFCSLPDKSTGSPSGLFLIKFDSPVNDDSSTFKSLLCIKRPSAGNKSPERKRNLNGIQAFLLQI